jgi:PPK2 family polyphosphate:nucleotide phosphotransferase
MNADLDNFCVKPGASVSLKKIQTGSERIPPHNLEAELQKNRLKIAHLQNKLYAENRQSLLIVLQGMDASGKDGTIKHIMAGVNPQGVRVISFKHPSVVELSHDYLWRHYLTLPEQGQIVIFNRSHYENVLISRVHPEYVLAERIPGVEKLSRVDGKFWKQRYAQIRNFETTMNENGTRVLKFFLHLSKDEQKNRFLERLNKKDKHWKFSAADLAERSHWKEYQKAYEQALENTSTKANPWYVIPADDKWFTQVLISRIIIDKLKSMKIAWPVPDEEQEKQFEEARQLLLNENQAPSKHPDKNPV